MAKTSVSDQLRRAVDAAGMSRNAICLEVDLDPATMSRFMSGRGGLSLETVDRIAELLELGLVAGKRKPGKGA